MYINIIGIIGITALLNSNWTVPIASYLVINYTDDI